MKLKCPNCQSTSWKAIEQVSAATPCEIEATDEGIEITMEASSEFVREMATSVTVAYTCANEECGFTIAPDQLGTLKEPRDVQQNFAAASGGFALGGIIPADTLIGLDAEHSGDLHFVDRPRRPNPFERVVWDPTNQQFSNGPKIETIDDVENLLRVEQEVADEETDTEGHKAAAAENLARAQEMREAREAEREQSRTTRPAVDPERFKTLFGS